MEKRALTWNLSEGNAGMWTEIRKYIYDAFYKKDVETIIFHFQGLLDDIYPFLESWEFEKTEDTINKAKSSQSEKDLREARRQIYRLMHKYKIYHLIEKKEKSVAAFER